MNQKTVTKYVHVGDYIAEVDVQQSFEEAGWSPTISIEDARRLDAVREALTAGQLEEASTLARVYRKEPIAV